jgi:hypothetical protein
MPRLLAIGRGEASGFFRRSKALPGSTLPSTPGRYPRLMSEGAPLPLRPQQWDGLSLRERPASSATPSRHPLPRPAPRPCHPAPEPGGAPEGGAGTARPQHDQRHHGRVQPRDAGSAAAGRRQARSASRPKGIIVSLGISLGIKTAKGPSRFDGPFAFWRLDAIYSVGRAGFEPATP